jgi:hypothetical protein
VVERRIRARWEQAERRRVGHIHDPDPVHGRSVARPGVPDWLGFPRVRRRAGNAKASDWPLAYSP